MTNPTEERLRQIVARSCNREGLAKRCPERIVKAVAEADT